MNNRNAAVAAACACAAFIALVPALGADAAADESPNPSQILAATVVSAAEHVEAARIAQIEAARIAHRDRQIDCLASAMWHEAGNQGRVGQIAVAEVILARVEDARWGDTPCAVIAERRQFSFVHDGVIPDMPEIPQTEGMEELAERVVAGLERSPVRGAKYFHATYVSPNWRLERVGQVGDHVFYADPSRVA